MLKHDKPKERRRNNRKWREEPESRRAGEPESGRSSARENPEGTGPLICRQAGRIYASQVSTGEHTRASVRSAVGTARSACRSHRSDRPRRRVLRGVHSTRRESTYRESRESRIANRESRATSGGGGGEQRVHSRAKEGSRNNVWDISPWWIRITGKSSRFVMTFVVRRGYFDISLARGEHGSMKYERVPRDFRNSVS